MHVEAGPHLHRSLQAIRALGKKAGVTLNPGTPVSTIEPVIDIVDLILVMSVNPGFGGRAPSSAAVEKISRLRALADGRPIEIEVDGGMRPRGPAGRGAGANVLVAGNAVFKAREAESGDVNAYALNIEAIRNAAAMAPAAQVARAFAAGSIITIVRIGAVPHPRCSLSRCAICIAG